MDLLSANVFPILWYIVLIVAVFAYALGDGFDLGIGSFYLALNKDQRRILIKSMGPIWDGNEVWLIIIFGGLLAGFPPVYGTLLSIFYMPIWTLVFFYIFRGCSLEFMSKISHKLWVLFWEIMFSASSLLISLFLGVLGGNLLLGVPLSPETPYAAMSWSLFFRPFAVLCGLVVLLAFSMHGVCFSLIKTPQEYQQRFDRIFQYSFFGFLLFFLMAFSVAFIGIKQAPDLHITHTSFLHLPRWVWLTLLMTVTLFVCFLCQKNLQRRCFFKAFICSSFNLFFLIAVAVALTFPNLLSSIDENFSHLTIFNSSANIATLQSLIIIVLIGLPLVIGYNLYIYRIFKGKTFLK